MRTIATTATLVMIATMTLWQLRRRGRRATDRPVSRGSAGRARWHRDRHKHRRLPGPCDISLGWRPHRCIHSRLRHARARGDYRRSARCLRAPGSTAPPRFDVQWLSSKMLGVYLIHPLFLHALYGPWLATGCSIRWRPRRFHRCHDRLSIGSAPAYQRVLLGFRLDLGDRRPRHGRTRHDPVGRHPEERRVRDDSGRQGHDGRTAEAVARHLLPKRPITLFLAGRKLYGFSSKTDVRSRTVVGRGLQTMPKSIGGHPDLQRGATSSSSHRLGLVSRMASTSS